MILVSDSSMNVRCKLTAIYYSENALKLSSSMHASVYKILAKKGWTVKTGDVLVVLEAMKMEINVIASTEQDGLVVQGILVATGDVVKPGDPLVIFTNQGTS